MTKANKGYIYLITCIVNGKFYVGQTRKYCKNGAKIGIMGRWKRHVYKATNHYNDCPKLNNAIRKYGKDNFIVTEIISCLLHELNHYEKYYIKIYDSVDTGYNCTLGGNDFKFSEKQRKIVGKKISDKAKKRWSDPEFKKNTCKKMREHIIASMKKCRKLSHLPSNIYECKNIKGILIGYTVDIVINKIRKRRAFASTQVTPKENLIKAKQYLKEIIESLE